MARRRREHDVVRAAVLETVRRHDGKFIADVAEPEARRIEHMRAEVVEDAGAPIAPLGIAHKPRRAVAVEHAAAIDCAERAGRDEVAHAHEMRLEAVIVGDVEHHAFCARLLLEAFQRRLVRPPQRLFDKRVLAVGDADSRAVRPLAQSGTQSSAASNESSGDLAQVPKVGFGIADIHGADEIGPREAPALVTLDAEPDDDDPHRRR